jgi:hypothetical protein
MIGWLARRHDTEKTRETPMQSAIVRLGQVVLIKRIDIASAHLIIFARGRQIRKSFVSPAGKTLHHYVEENHRLDAGPESLALAIRGKLKMQESCMPRQRTTDYTLTRPATPPTPTRRGDATQYLYEQLRRYVEQSDRAKGALEPCDAFGLGQGVPCDILHVTDYKITNWFMVMLQFSHLLNHELLVQYQHFHCLFDRVSRYKEPLPRQHLLLVH